MSGDRLLSQKRHCGLGQLLVKFILSDCVNAPEIKCHDLCFDVSSDMCMEDRESALIGMIDVLVVFGLAWEGSRFNCR